MSKQKESKIIIDTDFWRELGKDFDSGVQDFSSGQFSEMSILAAGIIESYNDRSSKVAYLDQINNSPDIKFKLSGSKLWQFFAYYKNRVFLNLLLILFIGLIAFGISANLSPTEKEKTLVAQEQGIPAFHKISPQDIKNFSQEKHKTLLNRYVLTPLPKNSEIDESQLLSSDLSNQMSERMITTLSIKVGDLDQSFTPGSKIGLVFSQNKQPLGKSIILNDVILLRMKKNDPNANLTVALKKDDFQIISDILALSDIYLILNR